MKNIKMIYVIMGILAVLMIAGAGGAVYYREQAQKAEQLLNNPDAVAKQETQDMVNRVGKLILLPNEVPQMATILDKDKLNNQPFFANAQNGDRILVFPRAQKAVLYRPSTNIIVEVGPLTMNATPSATQPGGQATPSSAAKK